MSFLDYIKSASNLRHEKYKLSNRGVKNGRVTALPRDTLIRLLKEVIRTDLDNLPSSNKKFRKSTSSSLNRSCASQNATRASACCGANESGCEFDSRYF